MASKFNGLSEVYLVDEVSKMCLISMTFKWIARGISNVHRWHCNIDIPHNHQSTKASQTSRMFQIMNAKVIQLLLFQLILQGHSPPLSSLCNYKSKPVCPWQWEVLDEQGIHCTFPVTSRWRRCWLPRSINKDRCGILPAHCHLSSQLTLLFNLFFPPFPITSQDCRLILHFSSTKTTHYRGALSLQLASCRSL